MGYEKKNTEEKKEKLSGSQKVIKTDNMIIQ